ncbi:MAG: ABC transporter permease [Proteobacteria bacterium]|nr:ABC transporter permease [Pseudomonadota bacterium]
MKQLRITFSQKVKYGIVGCVIFISIWGILGHILILHPEYKQFHGFHPLATFKAFYQLLYSPFFWDAVVASLKRVVVGLGIAFTIAVPTGMVIGYYDRIWLLTYTPIQFLRMISPLSWMPIAILVLPTFESAIYFLISMTCIWPIILSTAQGVNRVNPQFIDMARNQGANDFQLLLKIILPSSVPNIIVGFRMALGISWIILVPAEFLGITSGLGYSINDARDTLEYDRLLAIVVAIGFIGLLLDGSVKILEKKTDLRFVLRHHTE